MKPLHETREHLINGKKIYCPVCGYNRFWTRVSFPGDQNDADGDQITAGKNDYICGKCGHIPHRFMS